MTEYVSQKFLPARERTTTLRNGLILTFTGIWLMVAPFILGYYRQSSAMANDIIVGFITALLALTTAVAPVRLRTLNWASMYLGFWLFMAPFVLGYLSWDFRWGGAVPMWNSLVCGNIIWFFSYLKTLQQPA